MRIYLNSTLKPRHYVFPQVSRGRDGGSLISESAETGVNQKKSQLLTVDHSARGSMKTAASCVSVCESQEYQIHRQVERTLRRRHSNVLPSLLHEGRISNPCIGFVVAPARPHLLLQIDGTPFSVVVVFVSGSTASTALGSLASFVLRWRVWRSLKLCCQVNRSTNRMLLAGYFSLAARTATETTKTVVVFCCNRRPSLNE